MAAALGETLRRKFWLLPAVGLVGGVLCAYLMTELDQVVTVDLGLFSFGDHAAARNALSTLATATLSVAGITFTVTLVALQLASSQLSPRVLTTFREDRLTQLTLGAFLATFSYALVLLGRMQEREDGLPELSLSLAMLAALGSLALFVAFIGRTVASLQASTIIRRSAQDGRRALGSAHPSGIGQEPGALPEAAAAVDVVLRSTTGHELRARRAGYLVRIDGRECMRAAGRHDAIVVQEALLGDLVVRGQVVGRAHVSGPVGGQVLTDLERAFCYGEERTMAGDVAFPVRSLADIALRALSASMNDPTTAENAMGALVDTILHWLELELAAAIRVDSQGSPRLVARAPALDDLIVLGFEQVRLMVEDEHPLIAARLIAWLRLIEERSALAQRRGAAARRQIDLLRETAARSPS